jgi:hypothetical protein
MIYERELKDKMEGTGGGKEELRSEGADRKEGLKAWFRSIFCNL